MHSVFGVFAYLTAISIRNRFATMVKQIRNPRYAIALLFGAVYIWYFLFNRAQMPRGRGDGPFASIGIELLASLGLFVLFMRWWLFGNDRSALAFTAAEVQFFFPAPVTRRALIQFKLLRGQLAIILNAILWVLIFGRGGTDLPPALRAVSIWALFTIFMLHRLGATIVRAAATQQGTVGAKRNIIALAIFGAAAAGLVYSGVEAYPVLRNVPGPGELARAIAAVLQEPVPSALLAPFRILLAPTFARTTGEWVRDFLPVVVIAGLHYLWVIRTELAFEDAAVEASAQRARRIEAMRARRGGGGAKPVRAGNRSWIPLAPSGHPAVAILWKNVLALTRSSGHMAMIVTLSLVFGASAAVLSSANETTFSALVGFIALGLAGFSVLIGARFVRLDLRQDLVHLRLLRTYPVEGAALVAAEVAGSTLLLTLGQMGLLTLGHVMLLSHPSPELDVGSRWLLLMVAPIALLILNAASVTIQNGAALLFPAWVKIGTAKSGGVEVLGQSILTTLASLIALMLALLPAGIAAVAAFAGVQFIFQGSLVATAIVASVVGLATLAFEVGMAMTLLGEVFERGEMVGATTS
jgi:hypothetical protein